MAWMAWMARRGEKGCGEELPDGLRAGSAVLQEPGAGVVTRIRIRIEIKIRIGRKSLEIVVAEQHADRHDGTHATKQRGGLRFGGTCRSTLRFIQKHTQ